MTIQSIGSHAAALTLTAADLGGAAPGALSPAEVLRLARQALSTAGLYLPAPWEMDAYPGEAGLLLLIRSASRPGARTLPVRACRRGRVRREST